MTQVIFQPAGNQGGREHYRDTIETPVAFERVAQLADADTVSRLKEIYGSSPIPTWGATPGANNVNEAKWNRIAAGDLVLFLKEGRAFASGTVSFKTRNAKLARELWKTNEAGDTWELIYFLKDVRSRDYSYDLLNSAAEYDKANRFQGFSVLDPDRSERVLRELGLAVPTSTGPGVWWVNQGSTFQAEHDGQYLWAPTRDRRGVELRHHKNVLSLQPGDVVLHYSGGIRASSIVVGAGAPAQRPVELSHEAWQAEGYQARLKYRDLSTAIQLANIPVEWRTEEARQEPGPRAFGRDGAVVQGYLFELSPTFAARLRSRFPQLFEEGLVKVQYALSELPPALEADFRSAGFLFSAQDLARFVASLLAKPFVILTGLSGSGKTKVAQGLTYWLGCTPEEQLSSVVAVGPDWTSTESALGYLNALDQQTYSKTSALKLILHAGAHQNEPHFLILDEMNLSHVERYFADILSAMESGAEVHLHDGPPDIEVPPRIFLPANLFVIGTVNVDETTYMFSPKVLDRANVLEFRPDPALLQALMAQPARADVNALIGLGARYRARFLDREEPRLARDVLQKLETEILMFLEVLSALGFEFGYRTATEIRRFVAQHQVLLGPSWTFEQSVDAQVFQKILPRLHGSRRQIEGVLSALGCLCFEPRNWTSTDQAAVLPEGRRAEIVAIAADAGNAPATSPISSPNYRSGRATYPLSFDKVRRMLGRLERNGFTSFAEA